MRRTGDEIEPSSEVDTFDDMVDLVLDLVEAVWRLQGSALHFATGGWDAYALGTVEGHWDGSATARR